MSHKDDFKDIVKLLKEYDEFLVTSHVNPDGDNIGSSLAFKIFLEQLGKEVEVVIDDKVPDCFSFLPQVHEIKRYNPDLDLEFDALIVLDSGDKGRINNVANLVEQQKIINIDHHADNTLFGDYNLVRDVAATGELVYQLINNIAEASFNQAVATAIATALITDTGSFRYSNTTAQTHQIMAELLSYDIDVNYIMRQIFENNSYQSILLRAKVLEDLKLDKTGKISWVKISQEILEKTNATWEDAEGIVSYPRSIKGVEVAVLFKEHAADKVKVSLRSNEYFPVDEIAHQFDGGGHSKAAGCLIETDLVTAEERVITAVSEKMMELKTD
ncbi:MAG: DHH family phosphoesterase [Bacillota bacterium]